MHKIATALIVVGVVWFYMAFNMDTSITIAGKTVGSGEYSMYIPSQEIHNLDLADKRRNHLIAAGLTLIAGVLLYGFGNMRQAPIYQTSSSQKIHILDLEKKCPFCAEMIKDEAIICRFCGREQPEKVVEGDDKVATETVKNQFDYDAVYKIEISSRQTLTCPACKSFLKLSDAELVSKIMDCPSCNKQIKFEPA